MLTMSSVKSLSLTIVAFGGSYVLSIIPINAFSPLISKTHCLNLLNGSLRVLLIGLYTATIKLASSAYLNFFSISESGVNILLKLIAAKSCNGAPKWLEA